MIRRDKNTRKFSILFFVFTMVCCLDLDSFVYAAGDPLNVVEEVQSKKVGGEYRIGKIIRNHNGFFEIEFQSTRPSGRFDVLKLESDHVHVGAKEGQIFRLSAEILAEKGSFAEVSQIVIFLPGPTGKVPVWLLSHKVPGADLRAVRYLEMHDPSNDYLVM